MIIRFSIEDLERYIFDKDTKKVAEKQAVGEFFFATARQRRTERGTIFHA